MAKYWKNSIAISLSDGNQEALASSIAVSHNDVYVAGYIYNGNNYYNNAFMWKNTTSSALSDGLKLTLPESIFIAGTDVYNAGEEYNGIMYTARYWKNNIVTLY